MERDLSTVNCADLNVELLRVSKISDRERFLTLSDGYRVEQLMTVSGQACGATFTVIIPMTVGLLLPYKIVIPFNAPIEQCAELRRGFLWPSWELSPQNESRIKQLRQLQLPGVNFRHSWGGYKYLLRVGHEIASSKDNPSRSNWTVHSGYQGFVFGVGPRVAKYVKAASRLEPLLKEWSEQDENSNIRDRYVAPDRSA